MPPALSRRAVVLGGAGALALGSSASGAPLERAVQVGEPGTLFRVNEAASEPAVEFGAMPAWFRAAPAIWAPCPRSAGASLLAFAEGGAGALCERIAHFRQLPELLDLAKRQGANVVYLVDWYEGFEGATCAEVLWNKGDYAVRADLGGAAALRDGISAVRRAGGRVLLYLEPFIVHERSAIGQQRGEQWSIRTRQGLPESPYPEAWKLCPANAEMRAWFVGVTRRIFEEVAPDGLHLDSYGFQQGWACVETRHDHGPGDARVFDEGAKRLVADLLDEVRRNVPDAVLMCEGPKIPALFQWISGCQDWGIHTLTDRWAWRVAGSAPVFVGGWSLDDLHQVLALGHKLALGGDWALEAPQGTLVDALERHLPDPLPEKKDARGRRSLAEEVSRRLHRWRNAGLLLGCPMPNVDACTPRRGQREDAFTSGETLAALLEECRRKAREIDAALAGAGPLPPLEAHSNKLLGARAVFERVVTGATVRVVQIDHPHVAAYRFDGPGGAGATAVNVAGEPVDVALAGAADGEWRELVDGGTTTSTGGALRATLPPHSLRMWTNAG